MVEEGFQGVDGISTLHCPPDLVGHDSEAALKNAKDGTASLLGTAFSPIAAKITPSYPYPYPFPFPFPKGYP